MAERSRTFNSVYGDHIAATYVNDNKVVVAYHGYGENGRSGGYATLGFVEENNVFFNKPTLLHDSNIYYPAVVYDNLNDKVVVVYRDDLNGYGVVKLGTISGNDIVFSEPIIFSKSSVHYVAAMYDKVSGKVIIGYLEDGGKRNGIVKVGTITKDNITFSDPIVFSDNLIYSISMTHDSDNNKVVLAYCDDNNKSNGVIRVGTLVGDTMVFGNEAVFSDSNTYDTSVAYDYVNKKVIIAYVNANDKGMAKVGSISGDNVIFSEAATFTECKTNYVSTLYNNDKVFIAYRNMESRYINDEEFITISTHVVTGTVSENSVSFNEPVVFNNIMARGLNLVSDYNNKVVLVYHDEYNGYGTAKVI